MGLSKEVNERIFSYSDVVNWSNNCNVLGWNEIPEVVGSSVVALVGIGLAGIGLVNYYRKDGDNRRFKHTYVVMRPDDPRVAKIRQD